MVAGTPRGLEAGPRPAVPLGSSPPPGLSGSPAARAASQLTRGAEELSGAPRPAPPGRGAAAAIGQRAGPPGPQRPSDIREAIKGSGGAGSRTAAPPGCERLRSRESPRARELESERRALARRLPSAQPRAPLASPPLPARPQPRALGRRRQPRDSPARRRIPRQRLGRRPRPAAPSAPRLRGSPLFAPSPGSARPGRPQSFPGGGGGCASHQRWPRS